MSKVKNKTRNITNLTTNTALAVVENRLVDHSQYINTPEFTNLTAENFTARLKRASFTTKGDIAVFVKKIDFYSKLKNLNKKIISSKSKHLLIENELKKTTR